ncbi:MAG: ABC-F family ATP-binding cassette domain-containing protein [Leptonema sp. (in: Bacteria)]|nr:ABC-F family ATP-binding cassette domain-containing protein [Leptonema sp. (in: bacteria)]
MISFSQLSSGQLFHDLHIALKPSLLYCLTGPNGSGKSTLLSLIKQEADRRFLSSEILSQFDFDMSSMNSAGEHRSNCIETLIRQQPDLLLLDEPTNHLDSTSLTRLLSLLHRFSGTLLVVSHDRRLLKEADHIFHLENAHLEQYGGNWQLYKEQRENEIEARFRESDRLDRKVILAQRKLEKNIARQDKRRNHAESINRTQKNPKSIVNMQRNKADKTKARLEILHKRFLHNAESSALEANKRRLLQDQLLNLKPKNESTSSKPLITVQQLRLKRGNIDSLSFTIRANSRIGITGRSGSGKSTLAEAILLGHHIKSGEIIGKAKQPLFIDQPLRILSPFDQTVATFFISHYKELDGRTILAASGFPGMIQQRSILSLSGGERMRLALVMAFATKVDLLLLDEPTNDLDLQSREELEQALCLYQGALIVISHDTEFLESIGIEDYLNLD